jgi:hypothetical protein
MAGIYQYKHGVAQEIRPADDSSYCTTKTFNTCSGKLLKKKFNT